jgi:thiamine-monophosphate kinase
VFTQDEAIEIFTSILRSEHRNVKVGAGLDDVAVLKFARGSLAVTVDYTNFKPLAAELGVSSLFDRGYLLITHNVSDLIASGAQPLAAVVAIGLPNGLASQDIQALAKGIRLAADECDVAVIGGDTKEAPGLVLSATLIGRLSQGGLWARSGARPGDSIFLSGAIGGVSAAVLALSDRSVERSLQEKSAEVLARPKLPLALAKKLRRRRIRIAAIDISDGLGIDLHRLANASNVGMEIYATDITHHPLVANVAERFRTSPSRLAFGFGGDGQFVFTLAPEHGAAAVDAGAFRIGKILKSSSDRRLVTPNGEFILPAFGHQDFTGELSINRLLRTLKEPL